MISSPDNPIHEIIPPKKTEHPDDLTEDPSQILLETSPDKKSFAFRYFLAFTPCILVLVSIIARDITAIIIRTFFSAVDSTVSSFTTPASVSTLAQQSYYDMFPGSMSTFTSAFPDVTTITIFMIAPVGIFIIIAAIGWSLRITEVWTGTILSLGLSSIVGLLFVVGSSGNVQTNLLLYLEWIAFLVQPFGILATVVVLIWLVKFRQSIRYTLTNDGIRIRGGVVKKQEHLIPGTQVGRIVLEQNFFGRLYNFGTVIPVTLTRWGAETSIRGIGATGQQGNLGGGILFAKGREEASRTPLDCLYGIPDPKHAQKILARLSFQKDSCEAEQVSLLKKICDTKTRDCCEHDARESQQSPGFPTGNPYRTENFATHVERITDESPAADDTKTSIVYTDTIEPQKPAVNPNDPAIREVPPVGKKAPRLFQEATLLHESVPDQIKKLAELRDAGIITEDEFQSKKTELLARM